MNLPNKLTLLRVLTIPFFVLFMEVSVIEGADKYIAAGFFVFASITDALDGRIARKYNLITNFGKFMDPLADKLLVCSALICLTDVIPVWIVIVIISRELIISGFRVIAADNGIVIAASSWGKVKTVFQMIMIVWLIIDLPFFPCYVIGQMLIYSSLILTIVSLVDYMLKNKEVLRENNK